jgi:predicted naringenin-chalcone synthase
MMRLLSIASAFPDRAVTQGECLELLERSGRLESLRPRSRLILEKVLQGDSGIATRRLAPDRLEEILAASPNELNRLYEREAPTLASKALEQACQTAGVLPKQIDALLICTCTGYLCPGVTSHVSERLGLRTDALLLDLLGQGCGAALPMLEAAGGILALNPGALVATVAVEVCSAAFFLDDDPGVLISLCLFGDGAAAALWDDRPRPGAPRISGYRTLHRPEHREKVRFVNDGGRLRNQLDRSVPGIATEAVSSLWALRESDPEKVVSHTGGRDVLDALEQALGVPFPESRAVLRDYGNLSSPSVLVALEQALKTDAKSFWLTTFGAGFSAHCCRLDRGD